jgi:hypothetical protein
MTKTHLAPAEEYGDIYVDQPHIIETSFNEDIKPCKMRMDKVEEDDVYDWIESKEREYKPEKPGQLSCLNKNEKVAIIAAMMLLVIVLSSQDQSPNQDVKKAGLKLPTRPVSSFCPQLVRKAAHLRRQKTYAR